MIIEFGEWVPDTAFYERGTLFVCADLKPVEGGYYTIPAYQNLQSGTLSTRTIVGGFSAQSGTTFEDFCGDDQDLFRLTESGGTITSANASKSAAAYSVPSGNYWDFTQYGTQVLAVNGGTAAADTMQVTTIGGGAFADVSAGQPNALSITSARDFVVVGNTYDATDGAQPGRVRWAAFGDATSANAWDVSAATQADLQDLKTSAGAVQRVLGADDVFVVTDRTTYLMEYVGPPVVWRFVELTPGIGSVYPHSCVRDGNVLYMISPSGPVVVARDGSYKWIAKGTVKNKLREEGLDASNNKVVGFHDRHTGSINWSINAAQNCFAYFPDFDRWTKVGVGVSPDEYIWESRLSRNANDAIVETPLHKAGSGVFDNQIHGRNTFGNQDIFEIQTGALKFAEGRSLIKEVRVILESEGNATPADINVAVAAIDDPENQRTDATGLTFTTWTENAEHHQGFSEGRYHVFKITSTSGDGQRKIRGIEVTDFSATGRY